MKKRILSIALTLCMVLTLLTTTAFADTPISDFKYTVSEETGEVTITGYKGSDTDVVIPGEIDGYTVTAIGNEAFINRSSLKSVVIPVGVTSIGRSAFEFCTSLESVTIPDGVTSIGWFAFNQCKSLKSITIPGSVTSMEQNAFAGCTGLTGITVSDGVTSIGASAFGNCTSLTSITIPSSVTSIGEGAFNQCTGLTDIAVDENNTAYSSADGVLFNKDKTELIKYPEGKTASSYSIPGGVTTVTKGAFMNCPSLESIEIPNGVTSIGQSAFDGCTGLTDITIPDGVTAIEFYTFHLCTSLEKIELPNSLTTIEMQAFGECTSLVSIALPNSVTHIDDNVFPACTSLESIFLSNNLNDEYMFIPNQTTKVKYRLDTDPDTNKGEVTIIGITLGRGTASVAIPDTVCGYDVVAVEADEQSKVGAHTCRADTATCIAKSFCSICGKEYGDRNPDNHTGTKVWEQNETQHKQYWNCCDAVVIDCEDHTWIGGVCSVCDYICAHNDTDKDHLCDICGVKLSEHSGGTATCKDLAVCEYCGEEYGEPDSSKHNLENIPAKAATVTETGNIEYWRCLDCGKYFSDKDGEKEIELADTVINKLPPEKTESTKSPQTGDNSHAELWIALLTLSAAGIAGLSFYGKKKKHSAK